MLDIAYFGDMTLYNVRLPRERSCGRVQMNATRTVERPITWEDKVHVLFWSPDAGVVLAK